MYKKLLWRTLLSLLVTMTQETHTIPKLTESTETPNELVENKEVNPTITPELTEFVQQCNAIQDEDDDEDEDEIKDAIKKAIDLFFNKLTKSVTENGEIRSTYAEGMTLAIFQTFKKALTILNDKATDLPDGQSTQQEIRSLLKLTNQIIDELKNVPLNKASFDLTAYFKNVLENQDGNYTEKIIKGIKNSYNKPAIQLATMHDTVNAAKALLERKLNAGSWVEDKKPLDQFNNAYIKKKTLPPESEIIFFGDLHGSIHSLMRNIQELQRTGYLNKDLRLIKDNAYVIFLGDLVDYGDCGIDTAFVAFELLLRNPQRVLICRGNHEDEVQFNQPNKKDSLFIEIDNRYSDEDPTEITALKTNIRQLFFHLPYALFLKIDGASDGYAQCCHGGFEEGATKILQQLFQENNEYARLSSSELEVGKILSFNRVCCNFNWGDISGLNTENLDKPEQNNGRYERSGGRETIHMKKHAINEAADIMKKTNVEVVFRGHADQCNSFKATLPGINYPMYPLAKKTKFAGNFYQPAEWTQFDNLKPAISAVISNADALYETGFKIEDFQQVSPVAIFTFSNALTAKVVQDEGFGIVSIGKTWKDSILRAYVKNINDDSNILKDARSKKLFDENCKPIQQIISIENPM